VNLRQALVHSCDVFFYQLGVKLGIDRLAKYATGFGLGRLTGIELPGEAAGLVPTREWKQRVKREPWIKGETVSVSIGQGFNLVTPLQLAVAYAAIANGGQIVRPRILLGGARADEEPAVEGQLPVSPENLTLIREGLEGAVSERHGTGGRSRLRGVRVAGKTGTAQVVRIRVTEGLEDDEIPIRYRDHAWFVAYAPAEAPEILVAALVEHGGHGGSAAAPIVRRVLARYFEKRQMRDAADAVVASVFPARIPEEVPVAGH
jgi:penicillin-binding protein 2